MYSAPRAGVIHGKTQVQHFVEHHVFQSQGRHGLAIEDAADDDGIVRGIEMPQHTARRAAAPAELRPAQQTVEICGIEPLEDLVEIEMLAFGPGNEFAAADLFDQVGLPADVAAIEVEAIAAGVDRSEEHTSE